MPQGRTVLYLGLDPQKIDFKAMGVPPGVTAETIRAGIDKAMAAFSAAGFDATECMFDPGGDYAAAVTEALEQRRFDCVVIGGGLRAPPPNLVMFERVLNLLRRQAPQAAIAFNTTPDDTVPAAERALAET